MHNGGKECVGCRARPLAAYMKFRGRHGDPVEVELRASEIPEYQRRAEREQPLFGDE